MEALKQQSNWWSLRWLGLGCIAFSLFFAPLFVEASPILRTGENVSVEADQVLEGDFYALGTTVRISGRGNHDVLGVGASITLNAPVADDVFFIGGDVDVHAPVGDDVRVIAGQAIIADNVSGDLVVIAEELTVLSTARIEGDILFFGQSATISGEVEGNIGGAAEMLRVDTKVGGDITVRLAGMLTLGDKAEVLGNVSYTSPLTLVRAPGATVVGTVQQTETNVTTSENPFGFVVPLLMMLFAALLFLVLGKDKLGHFAEDTIYSYGLKGLVGFGVLIVAPFVIVLLMVSVLGFLVGAILLLWYLLALIIAWILSGVVVGAACAQIFFKRGPVVNVFTVLGGTLVFSLMPLVPIVGFLAAVVIFVIVLGGLTVLCYKTLR